MIDPRTPTSDPPLDKVTEFVRKAADEMLSRMRDGERRGWGTSWRDTYPDRQVKERLWRAQEHLFAALTQYRDGTVGVDEVRKRAADVANQAFMLADPERSND